MIAARSARILGGLTMAPLLVLASCGDGGTAEPDAAPATAQATLSVATPAPVVSTGPVRDAATEPKSVAARAYAPVRLRKVAGGNYVVSGPAATVGYAGPVVTYSLEVQRTVANPRLRASQLVAIAVAAFADTQRGWTWSGARRMKFIDDPSRARIRVVLARPARVDRYCARAGLNTVGRFSCYNGRVAALNVWRWRNGAKGFSSLKQYRTYLVNHEVGHGIGFSHRYCPARRAIAPVMQQQTKSLQGCRANAWPNR